MSWRRREEAAILTFVGTVCLGADLGIMTGLVMANLQVVWHASRPYVAVLGRLPDKHTKYEDICRFPTSIVVSGVVAFRFDAELFFANIAELETMVYRSRVSANTDDCRIIGAYYSNNYS